MQICGQFLVAGLGACATILQAYMCDLPMHPNACLVTSTHPPFRAQVPDLQDGPEDSVM